MCIDLEVQGPDTSFGPESGPADHSIQLSEAKAYHDILETRHQRCASGCWVSGVDVAASLVQTLHDH